jgi:peptide deformylase
VRILQYPRDEKLLRRKARPVRDDEFGGDALLEFVAALGRTMVDARGLGLAATQVEEAPGGEPWMLFVLSAGDSSYGVVCNPVVAWRKGELLGQEGCLSFARGRSTALVAAPQSVQVDGFNARGKPFSLMLDHLRARAAVHEVEHLGGGLMVDRMSQLKRASFLRDSRRAVERLGLAAN